MPSPVNVRFFATPAELRKWFAKNHKTAEELWLGYYKKGTGKPSVTWPESVDEALCVGWIDGIRKSLSEESYTIRFTPRRPGSIWSNVNMNRCRVLLEEGRMKPAGIKAFAARRENKSGIYAYEQRGDQLEEPYAGMLRADKKAWDFFQAQSAWWRKQVGWYVISAKKEETRLARLKKLREACARGERL